ncbi:MAG TPA: PAS domain S-box protein [Candidatus Binatia bacterium]|jgi:PAS domain S-box-containing protein
MSPASDEGATVRGAAGFAVQLQNAAVLAAAYFAVAGVSHAISPGDDASGFVWLPVGMLVAALVLTRPVEWPLLAAGALTADIAFGIAHHQAVLTIAIRYGVTVLEAVAGAVGASWLVQSPARLASPRDVLAFLFAAAMLATLIGASVAGLLTQHTASAAELARVLLPYWGSAATGVLALAPMMLAWSQPFSMRAKWPLRQIEAGLLLWTTVACLSAVFMFGNAIASPLRILLVGPVVWGALRFGMRGATAVHLALILAAADATGTVLSSGIRVPAAPETFGPVQTLVAMLVLIGLTVASALSHGERQLVEVRRSGDEVRRLSRLYASLSAVNHAVLTEPTAESFLQATCRILVGEAAMLLALVVRTDVRRGAVKVLAREGAAADFPDEVLARVNPLTSGPTATAMASAQPYVCNDFARDPRTKPWRQLAARHGIRASVAIPIGDENGVWGALCMYSREVGSFGDREVRLLEEIAQNIRFAIARFEDEALRHATGKALRESEDRFRVVMEYSPIGIAVVAPDGRWIDVNPALCRCVGYSRDELLRIDFQAITHPEDLATDLAQLQRALRGEIDSYQLEKRYIRKDGQVIWIQLDVVLVRDAKGEPRYFLSKIQDITDRRDAERRILELNATLEQRISERTRALEQANRELELANRELEAFSSSVSHDLRSPLRLIDGFSQMLARSHVPASDVLGQQDLGRIRAAARRMGQLIDSLLLLARLTRAPLQREHIDVSALCTEVVEALRAEQPDRVVHVAIEPGLGADASGALVRAVLENLIGNAWKFTARAAAAEIEVGREIRHGRRMFFVRDNGAGFKRQNVGRLFRAFSRLHDEKDFPGSGIGLATVHRIIERHDGTIEADSEENEGACFWFTLGDGADRLAATPRSA